MKFSVPSRTERSKLVVDAFYGIDYTNDPGNVGLEKSPNAPNMIRDVPGKVRKCMGYHETDRFGERINGHHRLGDKTLIHAGTVLYLQDEAHTVLYSDMEDERSKSWQFGDSLYIVDGKTFLVYDGSTVRPVSEVAKIPTFTIGRAPSGGGTEYEDLNLLQPKWKELFLSDGSSTAYHLSFSGLDADAVQVRVLNSGGEWETYTENNQFTVNRKTGVITFKTAPGKSPVEGEDNVEITAARTVAGYADKINKCGIGILFGVNGASDRLFLSGNPDFPNYDWFSGQFDPTYFADTAYSQMGTGKSAIVGYSIVNNYLATHKDENEQERNVIIRSGELLDKEPAFPIKNALQGPGAVCRYSFGYLGTEPVFLTRSGIYALTQSDISGDKYSQNRSYFMNGKLCAEPGMENSFSCVYKDLYWLCLNDVAYILDGMQSLGQAKDEPYSNRQYACFYRTNLPARVMWVEDETLYFGATDGRICAFYKDKHSPLSYNDCGEPIHAIWETPDFGGKLFYKNKTFRYLAVQLQSAVATSITMYSLRKGVWSLIKHDETHARYFTFSALVFGKLAFNSDETARTLHTKTRIKKVDKVRYRFENSALDEPFGLMQYAVEYAENGNYRG